MKDLLALDHLGNEINRILFKGDSDWYSRSAEGYNVYGQSYKEVLEQDIANVFHLNLNELSDEEHERLIDYVYGYVEAVV